MDTSMNSKNHVEFGEQLFKLRDYTPIPLILLTLIVQSPTVLTATLGVLLVAFGELFRLYSVAFIGSISRTRGASLGASLVTSGPFGVVRNPLYVANFLILLGFSVFSGRLWLLLLSVILFALQYGFIVAYEESKLSEKFGLEYEEYKKRVPAWFPASWPGLEALEWPISFSAALRSEKRTLTAIALVLCLMAFFS